jgi:glycosyltransferase involved in cell wall biosynthesis
MATRVSVALTTCNGARHLPALLDSIASQQRIPFEVVACDDASEDSTVVLLESFAARAPCPVRIHRNLTRLGVVENFSRVIAACSGDCIALADQDDVWHADKLARLADTLAGSTLLGAFSDANVVAENLQGLGYTMWQRVRFTHREQRRMAEGHGFEVLLKHHIVTGATLAFKVSLRDTALPIPPGWPHDAWLALLAAAQNKLLAIDEPLIDYRQHGGNVVGGIRKTAFQEISAALSLNRIAWYQEEVARWRVLAERLETLQTTTSARLALSEKIIHLETRANLPASRWRRLPAIWREISTGRYTRHARNWGSIAIDLLVR